MYVELLHTPPISGKFLERHFAVSARANAWVRFDDGEGSEWVGVFGSGDLAPNQAAIPFGDDGGRTVLVLAGGLGYVVDGVTGDLIRRSVRDDVHRAVSVPSRDFVLAADTIYIWAVGRADDRPAWRREAAWYDSEPATPPRRVALDGILFDEVSIDIATGKVWEIDGWYAFTLHLADMEFTRGALLDPGWERFGFGAPAG